MNYPEKDGLISLSDLALSLNFSPKKESFDDSDENGGYIPIELIELDKLYCDPEFQRLLNQGVIRKAKKFDKDLVRPLYVFKRPNGKYSVADGQHESVIGFLYTVQAGKLKIPAQVRIHPPHFTLEECLAVEANFFKLLNFRRRNVGKVDKLRADIAIGDEHALGIEQKLIDMNVNIEGIGASDGHKVKGYDKIMEAHEKYGVSNVHRAISKYTELQKDAKCPRWNDIDKPLNGALIGGLAGVYFMLNGGGDLGFADKNYALAHYMNKYLGKLKPTGKESLLDGTAGIAQDVLIARRIVSKCNALMESDVITKQDGEFFTVTIGEDVLKSCGMEDPSGMK